MLLFESIILCIKTLIIGIPSATLFVGILMYLSNIMTKELFNALVHGINENVELSALAPAVDFYRYIIKEA